MSKGLRGLVEKLVDNSDVLETNNAEKALELAQDIKPDLVLLDLQMPAVEGFEILAQLGGQGNDESNGSQGSAGSTGGSGISGAAGEGLGRFAATDVKLFPNDNGSMGGTGGYGGGSRGRAGTGGGASIGIWLFDIEDVSLDNNLIVSGNGGAGGSGPSYNRGSLCRKSQWFT